MKITTVLFTVAMPLLLATAATAGPRYHDNDEQALRIRDTIADPSVPLAWDRRDRPETWRYRYDGYERNVPYCGKRRYWDGDECVRKRRH